MAYALDLDLAARMGPATQQVVEAVLSRWPEHEKFIRKSFADRGAALSETTEEISALLLRVVQAHGRPLASFADDYRYLCEEIVFPEELFFRREQRYRLSTFEEAAKEVYHNAPLMARYMNGLFLSDAQWLNHASAMNDFAHLYLPTARKSGRHLEIGPGHGMLLHLALHFGDFANLSAWDVSATSVQHTRDVLSAVGESEKVDLQLRDLYDPVVLEAGRGRFDTIVFSEILEHLERPREALEVVREILAPGGSVWINVPLNGPAPDHLFLLRSTREAAELVAACGLEVVRTAAYPIAGYSLAHAERAALPVSCVVVGSKAA
jgi:2-polyprenyl-3-methyl-5-hydroxy-6-metoxy-1,4-benzoquinol methylase